MTSFNGTGGGGGGGVGAAVVFSVALVWFTNSYSENVCDAFVTVVTVVGACVPFVGADVGASLGAAVGAFVAFVGADVGADVGASLGAAVGALVVFVGADVGK
jgi:hypothetical protein